MRRYGRLLRWVVGRRAGYPKRHALFRLVETKSGETQLGIHGQGIEQRQYCHGDIQVSELPTHAINSVLDCRYFSFFHHGAGLAATPGTLVSNSNASFLTLRGEMCTVIVTCTTESMAEITQRLCSSYFNPPQRGLRAPQGTRLAF